MNSRIEQLFKQAGGYVENDNGQLLTYTQDLDVEKFAELIVADATECVRGVLREENSTLSYEDATAIQDSINQTFGIKSWREKLGAEQ